MALIISLRWLVMVFALGFIAGMAASVTMNGGCTAPIVSHYEYPVPHPFQPGDHP